MKILIVGADAQELKKTFASSGHYVENFSLMRRLESFAKPDCILIKGAATDFPHNHIVGLHGVFGRHTPIIALRPEHPKDKADQTFRDDETGQEVSFQEITNICDVKEGASFSLPSETDQNLLSALMKVAVRTSKKIAPKPEIGLGITLIRKSSRLSLGEKSVQLTQRENELLELLFEKDGQVIKLKDFLDRKGEKEVVPNYMSNNISRLRKKIVDVLRGNYSDKIATELAKKLIKLHKSEESGYSLDRSVSVEVSVTTNPQNKLNITP